jgi:hypothetical protein
MRLLLVEAEPKRCGLSTRKSICSPLRSVREALVSPLRLSGEPFALTCNVAASS